MEKAHNVCGIAAADFGWNDVGSWNAVYELLPGDGDGNVVAGESDLAWMHTTTSSTPAARPWPCSASTT